MGEEDATIDWTARMLGRRNDMDRAERRDLGIAKVTDSVKRKDQNWKKTGARRRKRKRYENLGEDWGRQERKESTPSIFWARRGKVAA